MRGTLTPRGTRHQVAVARPQSWGGRSAALWWPGARPLGDICALSCRRMFGAFARASCWFVQGSWGSLLASGEKAAVPSLSRGVLGDVASLEGPHLTFAFLGLCGNR